MPPPGKKHINHTPPIRSFAASRVGKNEVLTAGLTNLDEHDQLLTVGAPLREPNGASKRARAGRQNNFFTLERERLDNLDCAASV